MLTMAEELADGLSEIRQESNFEATYHKKDGTTLSLTKVVRGTKKWRFNDDNLMSQHIETTDFIFGVDQFTDFRRGTNEPFAGDTISLAVGVLDLDVFELISVNKERVWHFSDPQETTLRVHTQFLRREAA